MLAFEDIKPGSRLRGLDPAGRRRPRWPDREATSGVARMPHLGWKI